MFAALRESAGGPLPRWRSPDLAAAYWGGPAATVASGPQGHAPDWREGQLPQDRGRGPQAPVAARPRRAGRGGRCQRDGDGSRGGVGRDPGLRGEVLTVEGPHAASSEPAGAPEAGAYSPNARQRILGLRRGPASGLVPIAAAAV
jgi:hypothetical protein